MKITVELVAFVLCFYKCASDQVLVTTNVGDVAGLVRKTELDGMQKDISVFLGVPFAETTAGENRFKKPIPKQPFNETFNATKVPLACIQTTKDAERRYSKLTNFSEDCLTLNIYVPRDLRDKKENNFSSLPVMIWIYGGAFITGATAAYPGDVLSAFGDVIVVAINYRVGMFGFLSSSDGEFIGNQGLWDQQLGIKWVHENIAAFNGDPENVTLFGESAGGASVIFQALHAGNRGYFQRVIAQSGTALAFWATSRYTNAERFLKIKECDAEQLKPIECLQEKSAHELQLEHLSFGPKSIAFGPVLDNDFLVDYPEAIVSGNNPEAADAREFFASLDIITGVTNAEGAFFVSLVWPSFLNYTDVDNLKITRDEFVQTVIKTSVKNFLNTQYDKATQLISKTIDFAYTDWSLPNDSDKLRMSLVNLSGDIGFNAAAVFTAQSHTRLYQGRTYFYEFSVEPAQHKITTPSWIKG